MPNGEEMGWDNASAAIASTVTERLMESGVVRWGSMLGGLCTSFFGWITSAQGLAAVGLLATIGGFTVNYIYQKRRDRREAMITEAREAREVELQQAKLAALREGRAVL